MISDRKKSIADVEARKRGGKTAWAKLRATSEDEIERAGLEEEAELDAEFGPVRDRNAFGSVRVVIPGPDVRALRDRMKMSQDEFAARFGISMRTLQQWEQRRRVPDGPARLLLAVIEVAPDVVERVAHERGAGHL